MADLTSSFERPPLRPLDGSSNDNADNSELRRRRSKIPLPRAQERKLAAIAKNQSNTASGRLSKAYSNDIARSSPSVAPPLRQKAISMNFTATTGHEKQNTRQHLTYSQNQQKELELARDEAKILRNSVIYNENFTKDFQELKRLLLDSKEKEVTRIQELMSKISVLERDLVKAETEAEKKSAEIIRINFELTKAGKHDDAEKTDLQLQLKCEKDAREALRKELEATQNMLMKAEEHKASVECTLQARSQELEQIRLKMNSVDPEKAEMRSELSHLRQKCERTKTERAGLESELEECSEKALKLQQTVRNLQFELVEKTTQIDAMKAEILSLNARCSSLEGHLEDKQRVAEKQLQTLKKYRDDLAELSESSEMKISKQEQDHLRYKQKMEQSLQDLAESLTRSEADYEQVTQELRSAKSELSQYRSTVSSQESALTLIRSQISLLEAKLSAQADLYRTKEMEMEKLSHVVEQKSLEIQSLERQAHVDEEERRKLHNALQELKGNIRVFCRVRPLLAHEKLSSTESLFSYGNNSRGITASVPTELDGTGTALSKQFTFDRVFHETSTQEEVFSEISQLVQSALDGYRVCIFAYGQTGSGKTHTIIGSENDLGMVPRSIQQIFDRAERLSKDRWQFEFRASFLEIYNEKIADLLCKNSRLPSKQGNCAALKVKREEYAVSYDEENNECKVDGLTVVEVKNPASAIALVTKAMKNRATASTKSNAESSRSHSVFRLYIKGSNSSTGQNLRGVLNLVDLAGSERVKVSMAEGDRLRETKAINKSLSQLSVVIQNLANKDKHIPYRSSKLTRLLQDSLGGDSKTLMFVNVSPVPASYAESMCSLRFAEQVNACDIGVASRSTKVNLVGDDKS